MLKVNFTVSQLRKLIQVLYFQNRSGDYDPELELMQSRLEEVLEVDRWNPLRQLPPLGVRVLLKSSTNNILHYATRTCLADSYSPESLQMSIDGVEEVLLTSDWYWTSEYD